MNDSVTHEVYSSEAHEELFALAGLPPSAPSITNPLGIASYYNNQGVQFNWTASQSPNYYPIANYTGGLVYVNESPTAYSNLIMTLGTSYLMPSLPLFLPNGVYLFRVVACDSMNQCTSAYSDNLTFMEPTPIPATPQPAAYSGQDSLPVATDLFGAIMSSAGVFAFAIILLLLGAFAIKKAF